LANSPRENSHSPYPENPYLSSDVLCHLDAVKKGKLSRNVANLADPPLARKAETKVWNEQKFDGFLTAAGRGPYYTLLATLACTGVRVREGLGLQWGDLELYGDPRIPDIQLS